MVAKIKHGKSLIGALNYNERKVSKGSAVFLGAINYVKDDDMLTFNNKLERLTDLARRNQLTKTNTFHASLNFEPSELLNKETLLEISEVYMAGIGFENQPCLIYQHLDAGHPHIHLLSTNIRADGKRISMHNIGRDRSEKSRQMIENSFGLIKASKARSLTNTLIAGSLKPLVYGTVDSRTSVSTIVNEIAKTYNYTSIPEFNAILNRYNVLADRGAVTSVMFKQKGLRYWILDSHGKKTGVPLKASALKNKPTLKLLEQRFQLNRFLRKAHLKDIQQKIDGALASADSKPGFQKELANKNVQVIFRQNAGGRDYGITFLDQEYKMVVNGSDLGKTYGINGITERLNAGKQDKFIHQPDHHSNGIQNTTPAMLTTTLPGNSQTLLDDLLGISNMEQTGVPHELQYRKKKKRKLKL